MVTNGKLSPTKDVPSQLGYGLYGKHRLTVILDRNLYSLSFHQYMGTFWFNSKTESGSFVGITWPSLLFAFCFHHCCAQTKMLFVADLVCFVSSLHEVDNISLVGNALLTLFSKEALKVIHELKWETVSHC